MEYVDIKDNSRYRLYQDGSIYDKLKNKFINQRKNGKGYKMVSMNYDGKFKDFCVHKLLAEYFIPNPNNYEHIKFLDGNVSNISLDNMQWMSNSNISRIGYENLDEETKSYIREKQSEYGNSEKNLQVLAENREKQSVPVRIYGTDSLLVKECASEQEAAEYLHCKRCNVSNTIAGRQKTCKGYIVVSAETEDEFNKLLKSRLEG